MFSMSWLNLIYFLHQPLIRLNFFMSHDDDGIFFINKFLLNETKVGMGEVKKVGRSVQQFKLIFITPDNS